MKPLKVIANAIEKELNVNVKDCTVYYQGTNYGDNKSTTLTAAIVGIDATNEMYKIRVWHDRVNNAYCRPLEKDEFMKDAFRDFLCI